ncbi:hypothetical protein JCM19238_716 [Vibrio ponticus]|nr:hypothetical protein JCM19238_716 [Vibrio ponticus]
MRNEMYLGTFLLQPFDKVQRKSYLCLGEINPQTFHLE